MAKRILLESYTFVAGSKTLTINNRFIRREQIILITNTTTNTVMYNFADNSSGALTITVAPTANAVINTVTFPNLEQTVITWTGSLSFSGMANEDKIAILVEETNESFQPSETLMDPVGKHRTSAPQALIDTDFEYGTQPTKWESVALVNNRPSAFFDNTSPVSIINITSASTRVVTVTVAYSNSTGATSTANSTTISGLTIAAGIPLAIGMVVINAGTSGVPVGTTVVAVLTTTSVTLSVAATTTVNGTLAFQLGYPITTNTPLYFQDTTSSLANGWQMPNAVTFVTGTLPSSFTYYARETISTTGSIYDASKTYLFVGSFYTGAGITVNTVSNSAFTSSGTTVTVTTVNAHGLSIGQGIYVTNITGTAPLPIGAWVVNSVASSNTFTFLAAATPGAADLRAIVGAGGSGATINVLTVTAVNGMGSVSIGTAGTLYQVGDLLTVATGVGGIVKVLATNATNGAITAVGIYAPGTSGYSVTTLSTTLLHSCCSLYVRTWGAAIHRPFDGGVSFSAGLPYHGNQLIRQTRRYFRYQSGKGIQFSTGSNMCSPFQVDSITVDTGNTVIVTTKFPHNLGIGAAIKVEGAIPVAYNGSGVLGGSTFVVTAVVNDLQFKYVTVTTASGPATSSITGTINVQPIGWYGASVRVGMFDAQNGFYFQYDGQTVSAVRRNSTGQVSGYLSQLGQGNQVCTGIGTRWASQLAPGNFIVIRGQSHIVVSIESDTSMTIYPDYKGSAILPPSQVIISKTIDTKYNGPSSISGAVNTWNIDTCDGKGSSGYTLDISKMQMWIMDYSWYGAGAIRYGFKNQRGEVMFVHRIAHGNGQTEAYMRSGNLPARYEVNTFWPTTTLAVGTLASGATSVTVADASGFPLTNGAFAIQGSGNTGAVIEYVKYTTLTLATNTFSGCTRGCTVGSNPLTGPGGLTAAGGAGATAFTATATAPVTVSLYAPTAAATISHWGSSVMMDGRYDDDKSFVFNYGTSTPVTFGAFAGVRYPVFSLRLSPSVDNGFTGLLGTREIINRMQLQPSSCGVFVTGTGVKVEVFLNARVSAGTFSQVGGSSLAQVANHGNNATMTGGECIYTFFAPVSGVSTQDLSKVRDIGNSILGGGTHNISPNSTNNLYPDGPDIITLAITPLTAVAPVVAARINWTEAQA